MIDFSKATFIKSAPTLLDKPLDNYPEVLFVGRSNVGKSSLINALTKRKKLAFTSSKPGYTKLLNYYLIDDKFYLVDAPGYGYTSSGSKHLDAFSKMMESYFQNPHLSLVVLLLDSRRTPNEDDLSFVEFLKVSNIKFLIVMSKIDKLNQSETSRMKKNILDAFGEVNYLTVSINKPQTLEKVKEEIAVAIKNK